jgi:hypothetical protein
VKITKYEITWTALEKAVATDQITAFAATIVNFASTYKAKTFQSSNIALVLITLGLGKQSHNQFLFHDVSGFPKFWA